MKNLLIFLFILICQTSFSQNFIYMTKKFSVVDLTDDKPNWSKWHRVNSIIIFSTDSLYNDTLQVERKVMIYSNIYQDINLDRLNSFNRDSDGNYNFDFIGKDEWGNDCDFSYSYYKKRIYIMISYNEFAVKFILKKKRWTSVRLKTRKISFTSITKNSNYVSG
jgi:hypothetical protein